MARTRKFDGKTYTYRVESNSKNEIEKNKKYLQKYGSSVRITKTKRKKRLSNISGAFGSHKGTVYVLWSRK